MGTLLFLALRALHVLLAAIWVGATAFILFILMPSIEETGPAGGQVMMRIDQRGVTPLLASLAGTTALTGIYLFWRFTGGFDPAISRTHAGMAFGIGGAAGILAAIIGGSVVGRTAKKLGALMGRAMTMPEGPERGSLMQTAAALRERMKSATRIVLILQIVALLSMAVAHYI